jgi:hypothetical protein
MAKPEHDLYTRNGRNTYVKVVVVLKAKLASDATLAAREKALPYWAENATSVHSC